MKYLVCLIGLFVSLLVNGQTRLPKISSANWITLEMDHYAIGYPDNWRIDTTRQFGADLLIFSPKESDSDRFVENVNVVVQDLTGTELNLDKFVELTKEQLKSILTNVTIIQSERVNPGANEYHKIIFSGSQGAFTLEIEQYVYIREGKAYLVTFTAEQKQFARYKGVGEKVLKTFKVKG